MPASLSSPFFPLPSSASPSNPNAHVSPSPPSPRRRLIPKSNHRHHRLRLSLYLLSITSRKRCIHWLLFLFIDASRSLFLLSVQDSLLYSRAFWVTQSIIAWNADAVRDGYCYLYASQTAALTVTDTEVEENQD
ncbi:hypothetical protein H0E87_016540 [Populus deltoides]|uniref:Pullulanase N2 domain-containing protein n=1 Tax=Populus deltoides TaxID=3696 RepID=A0A8T2Y9W9_POPDE|nr:hypothetical protein H0E87_016540 [Populus deltoides]